MKKIVIYLFALMPMMAQAQCGIENTAFKSGEVLEYDLKFNWKLIWFTVGTATMDTKMTKFEGKDAWRSYLITRGNNTLDKATPCSATVIPISRPFISVREPVREVVTMLMRCGILILVATAS